MIIDVSHRGRHVTPNNLDALPSSDYLVPTGTIIGDTFDAIHYPGGVIENWSCDGAMHGGAWGFHSTDVLARATKPGEVIQALTETINPLDLDDSEARIEAIIRYLNGQW